MTRWNIYVTVNYEISLYKLRYQFLFSIQTKVKAGIIVQVLCECWTCAIHKIKEEINHWQWKMEQHEYNSHCFLSQPQLCAHSLLAHCHLSLSQALASSPTAPTRPGQCMPLPNIHLLPSGFLRI